MRPLCLFRRVALVVDGVFAEVVCEGLGHVFDELMDWRWLVLRMEMRNERRIGWKVSGEGRESKGKVVVRRVVDGSHAAGGGMMLVFGKTDFPIRLRDGAG